MKCCLLVRIWRNKKSRSDPFGSRETNFFFIWGRLQFLQSINKLTTVESVNEVVMLREGLANKMLANLKMWQTWCYCQDYVGKHARGGWLKN